MTVCPFCGRENATGARFCNECGASLTDRTESREQRKVVTVVFSDVVGSTAIGERLDPESLRRVMSRYFQAMQAALERHGGTVEKFIGDAVMAVFGVPAVHEDDALRAVRAAAEMREALLRLNEELEREHLGVRIEIRTGVNTGEVVAGDAASRQKLVTGDAVNVAARLEQAAGAGEILIGDPTYQLVRDAVRVEPLEPLELKGKSDRLPVWRLTEVLPDVPAFERAIDAPFVGRTEELESLHAVFDEVVRERACALATVVGPPGIGKSRLARELVAAVGASARVVVGRCLPYGEGVTYAPLAEIVRLVERGPEGGVAALVGGDEGPVVAKRIATAIGADVGAGSPEETAWAVRRLFEALARQRPLVVVIDDIHWAEPTLLDLLEYVQGFASGAPVLLLCMARPDLFDARPSWAAPRAKATILRLEPLADDDVHRLVERVGQDGLSASAAARIVETAEGNPLFVEQLIAMGADGEANGAIPPTIHALLTARIDRLEPDERAVLERAAVEGPLFHRGAVTALLPPLTGVVVGSALLTLIRKEFVRPDRALFEGDDGFRFNHVLIRDAAYDALPKLHRAELHERHADWLEARAGGDELVGFHLEQAHRLRAELGSLDEHTRSVGSRAGRALASAGRRASARGDARAATGFLERAVTLLEADPSARVSVLPDYGLAIAESGDLMAAERVLLEAVDEARRAGDRLSEMRAEVEFAYVLASRGGDGWEATGKEIAGRAVAAFGELGAEGELANALILQGYLEGGDRRVAALLQARRHATAVGDERRLMHIWVDLGGAMLFSRTPVAECDAFFDEELAWAAERGVPFLEADGTLGKVYVLMMVGRLDEARVHLDRAQATFQEVGFKVSTAEAFGISGQLEILRGDAVAAERELRVAMQAYEDLAAPAFAARMRIRLAEVFCDQRRYEEAAALLRDVERGHQVDHRGLATYYRRAMAKLAVAEGRPQEAVEFAREAVERAAPDDLNLRGDAYVALGAALRAAVEHTEAAAALGAAVRLYEEKGSTFYAARAREHLAALTG